MEDSKTFLFFDYIDDLNVLSRNASKMNGFLEVLTVQDVRIAFTINTQKTKSLKLGIGEGEEVMLGNQKISRVNSFTYLRSIIRKDAGYIEDVKNRIAMA